MVLVDVNLLVHAVNADSPDHAAAQAWLDNLDPFVTQKARV